MLAVSLYRASERTSGFAKGMMNLKTADSKVSG